MRFSLSTLVVITLWVATAMLVWAQWEPWYFHSNVSSLDELPSECRRRFALLADGDSERHVSPDGSRFVAEDVGEIAVWDAKSHASLTAIPVGANCGTLGFGTDDCIVCMCLQNPDGTGGFRVYSRRHLEWWWGHLYRPEVWALVVLTGAMGVLAVRRRLKRRAGVA